MSDNTITLVGNLTRDPELRFTTTGRGVASFGIAVGRRYQVNGEWQEPMSSDQAFVGRLHKLSAHRKLMAQARVVRHVAQTQAPMSILMTPAKNRSNHTTH